MKEEIFNRLKKCLVEVLGVSEAEIRPESRLIDDLGADSLDFVDLIFTVENEFSVKIQKSEFELSRQLGLTDEEIEKDGLLTEKAIEILRQKYPEQNELFQKQGLKRRDLLSIITAKTVSEMIEKKL